MNKKNYKKIHKNLLEWYQSNGRTTLPWRVTNNPYKIYLSEIMLQQTQVKTVLERFYFQFLQQFPSLESVALAQENNILKAWEGLGYYTRARNLHKTAQATQGKLPTTAEELEKLSGIGKSTAHAVACFAFNESLPILDANVKRILYRFFAIKKCTDKELWEKAFILFDKENSYIYNQSMMDIGSQICTHKSPHCKECPFQLQCAGQDQPLTYPEKKIKKIKPIKKYFILVKKHHNTYALKQNSSNLLGGLWAFEQAETVLLKNFDIIGNLVQHYSHFKLEATIILINQKDKESQEYFTIQEIDKLALSNADKKVLSIIKKMSYN